MLAGSGDAPTNTVYVQPSQFGHDHGCDSNVYDACVGGADHRSGATHQGGRLMNVPTTRPGCEALPQQPLRHLPSREAVWPRPPPT